MPGRTAKIKARKRPSAQSPQGVSLFKKKIFSIRRLEDLKQTSALKRSISQSNLSFGERTELINNLNAREKSIRKRSM